MLQMSRTHHIRKKTTIAKAINTHLSKKHTELTSRARDKVRMEIFNKNHVLVANDVATATVMDLKLDSEVYEEVAEYQSHHGTSTAQATATTQEFSRDEFVLRNSMIHHPEPHDLFMITGLFTRDAKPSKSLMNFLRAIERDIKIKIVDWRSLIAITSNRRRVKECLSNTYERSAQSGYMTTLAPRKIHHFHSQPPCRN